MRLGRIRNAALSLGVLTLLAACQTAPTQRGYVQSYGYSPAYDPCQDARFPCGQPTPSIASGRICPPGYRLVRMSYRLHGGSARDCVPGAPYVTYRYAGGPPYGISSYQDCGRGVRGCGRAYREVRYRSAPRSIRGSRCCY